MTTSTGTGTEVKKDNLRCHLCKEMFRKPKSLECSHSFCEDCLRTHVQKFEQQDMLEDGIACPRDTCSKRTKINQTGGSAESWVEALPTNLELMSLTEVAHGQDDADETPEDFPMCGHCHTLGTETKASLFCINCNEPQCSQCSEHHSKFAFLKDHTVVGMNQMKKTRDCVPENLAQCEIHSEDLKFFCKNHNKLCCSMCVVEHHRHCGQIKKIADMANEPEAEARFRPVKGKMVALKQKLKVASTIVESNRRDLTCQFDSLPMEIEVAEGKIAERFEEIKNQISSREALNQAIDDTKAGDQRCNQVQNKLDKTLQKYETCVVNGSKLQKFIATEKLNQQYRDLVSETDDCLKNVNTLSVKLELTEQMKQVLTAKSVGKIAISRQVINIESFLRRQLKLKKSIELTKGEKGEQRLLTGLTFLSDGRLIAVDNWNSEMILFDGDMVTISSHKLPDNPTDIASVNEDEVLITKGCELLRYRITSNNQIKRLASITGQSKTFSLCPIHEGLYLVGLYDTEKPACIINDEGAETPLDINFKQMKYGIGHTICCYSPTTDSVILAENTTNTVYIYGMSDKSEVEVKDKKIVDPRGVAVSSEGCIFVCSWTNDSIVQLSPSGSVINSTRCEGMDGPYSICLHHDGRLLAVANNNSKRQLQIYNIV